MRFSRKKSGIQSLAAFALPFCAIFVILLGDLVIYHREPLSHLVYGTSLSLVVLLIAYLYELKRIKETHIFDEVTEAAAQMIHVQNANGEVFYNQRWVEYAGKPPVGEQFWLEIVHPEDHPAFLELYSVQIPLGQPFRYENRIKRQDGIYLWHLVRVNPTKDEFGQVKRWVTTTTDISDQKRAEAQLEEKTQFLSAILDHIPSGVVVANHESKVILTNKKAMEFLPFKANFKMGDFQGFAQDGTEIELQNWPLPIVLATGKPNAQEITLKATSGQWNIFGFTASPVLSQSGKLIGAVSIIEDVSAKRKDEVKRANQVADERAALEVKRAKKMLEELVENIPAYIMIKNAKTMKYELINGLVKQAMKISGDVVIGATAYDLYPAAEAALVEATDRAAMNSHEPILLPRHDITVKEVGKRILQTTKFVLRSEAGPEYDQIVGVSLDLTELYQARDQAELLAKMKSEFLATMSHEIRTPLNGVIGMSELVLDGELNAKQRNFMNIVKESGNSLLQIVNDILDYSKVEAGVLSLEHIDFDVREAFKSHVEILQMRAESKDLNFSCTFAETVPKRLNSDPNRIIQILNNLITNAIKFTAQGSVEVSISFEASSAEVGDLIFKIKDSGIGISVEEQNRLFKPFVQADGSMARRFGGTGLGLSISKQLAHLLNGEIGVTSLKGKGSEFWFKVQAKPVIDELSPDSPKDMVLAPLPPKKPLFLLRILLAEDNRTNQILMEAIVERMGYEMDVVVNGREAVEASAKKDYDVILMDCQMPELDGFGATEEIRLRERSSGKHVPIIALTANARVEDRDKCLAHGMDDFVSKPINRAALNRAILQWSMKAVESQSNRPD